MNEIIWVKIGHMNANLEDTLSEIAEAYSGVEHVTTHAHEYYYKLQ